MRRRTLLEDKSNGNGMVDGSKATPMSVVFANKNDGSLTIVEGDKWSTSSHPVSTFEPIGIVVIPGEHGVLKSGDGVTNQCGVMSLVPMNCSTPEKGGTSLQGICWSDYENEIYDQADGLRRYDSISDGLTTYYLVNHIGNNGKVYNTIQGTRDWACLPSDEDDFFIVANPYDNKTSYYFNDSDYYAPSPYKNDGSYNPIYSQTTSPGSPTNALSDFKGIVNTKIITDLATAQSDWKTASAITNSTSTGYYPAACCCARFKTTGTKAFVDCSIEELRNGAGFWYLPACGELGYVMVRYKAINDTIDKLKASYGVGVNLSREYGFWSSSQANIFSSRLIHTGWGQVTDYTKDIYEIVYAFMRL